MRAALEEFFLGRTGMDQLNKALLGLTAVSYLVSVLAHQGVARMLFHYICLLTAAVCVMRAMSRDLERRRGENQRFLGCFGRIHQTGEGWRVRSEQRREYKVFKCPSCGVKLRVPRGKGKLWITCRQCGAQFEKKS